MKLQYSMARMYDPEKGRFLQTDWLGYVDGMNPYAYVGNDPINFTDPSGTRRWCVSDHTGERCFGQTDEEIRNILERMSRVGVGDGG